MANRTFFTDYFRASFPHLAAPHAANDGDTPKFSINMMFPKSGVCTVNPAAPSSINSLWQALNEVCMEEWNIPFHTVEWSNVFQGHDPNTAAPRLMGVQFPPNPQNGDTKYVMQKGTKTPVQPLQVRPETAGMWIISAKNTDPVGVVGADGKKIVPEAIYSGCWCRAQIEASAYTGAKGNVIQLRLINVQMAYDDTKLAGGTNHEDAESAFANMAVSDTNIAAGTGQLGTAVAPMGAAPAPAATGTVIMNPGLDYAAYIAAGWTDETLVAAGHAKPNFLQPQ